MAKKHSEIAGQRREYHKPQLVRYGALKDLTRSGAGTEPENTKPNGKCRNSKNKYACASDRNLKENIVYIGKHPLGMGLYLFDFRPEFRDQWGHGRQFGVMAQEVEKVMPEAVSMHFSGYKAVNYGMLGISRTEHQAELHQLLN